MSEENVRAEGNPITIFIARKTVENENLLITTRKHKIDPKIWKCYRRVGKIKGLITRRNQIVNKKKQLWGLELLLKNIVRNLGQENERTWANWSTTFTG